MFFALTDEQRALDDSVRDLLADRVGPTGVRAVVEDPDGDGHPVGLWRSVGEQGWLAVLVPEPFDGLGLGLLDATVIARRFGAATAPGPWAVTVLGAEAVRLAGTPDQQVALLPAVAAGETVLTVALHGEGQPWSVEGVTVTADGSLLTGTVHAVEYAHVADRIVVAARTGGDVALYLVDPGAAGVTLRRYESLDRTTRLGELRLDGAAGERLGDPTPGAVAGGAAYDELLRRAAVLTAADLVGVAGHALRATVAYDKERVQFGRPVGSFQAIKHDLADLHVAVTMAEHGVLYAAHALDTARDDAALMASVAKAKASDVARDATAAMIQYHGGIGYTWEHEAHLYFKRAKREEYAYGDAVWHREQVARLVVDRPTETVVADPDQATSGATVNATGVPVAAG